MAAYKSMSNDELLKLKQQLENEYAEYKNKNLSLDMSRGKPGADQLDLATEMLDSALILSNMKSLDGADTRNYGGLDGILEAKNLFAQMLEVEPFEVIVGGNSSLNMMYDSITRAILLGVYGASKPWGSQEKIKFLCPSPGYDRHFAICEQLNIEMIPIKMLNDGPDMDMIEELVSSDASVKGVWCVPKYSNPDGITYSDEVVRRFATLKPKADDFRIFWDNAYCVHDINDTPDTLLNILDECKKAGNPHMVYIYTSTSKISFSGAGLAAMAASKENIDFIKKQMTIQTIGPDKLNQLRHARFFNDIDAVKAHMKKHADIIKPKFDVVLDHLNTELKDAQIGSWTEPNGGYFVSFYSLKGCAKRIAQLCKDAGVTLTPAGVTFPYGKDEEDSNLRIAPTYPPLSELELAMKLFCLCVKIASVEKILADR